MVMKALAISRGQLAAALAVDKSIVSRWLSGQARPSDHNGARLTAYVALSRPGFTMFDWDAEPEVFAARLGLGGGEAPAPAPAADAGGPAGELPPWGSLPALALSRHETAARGGRYCGLWESIMPTVGRPDDFHREHTLIRQDGPWLSGEAIGVSYRWALTGCVANGQLILWMSDTSDFIFRQFNRADEPIVDQIDGLMLAAASLPHQAPTACRVIMARVTSPDADASTVDAALAARAPDRRFLTQAELPPGMARALLPDCGPSATAGGGERLLRADPTLSLVRTRWF